MLTALSVRFGNEAAAPLMIDTESADDFVAFNATVRANEVTPACAPARAADGPQRSNRVAHTYDSRRRVTAPRQRARRKNRPGRRVHPDVHGVMELGDRCAGVPRP